MVHCKGGANSIFWSRTTELHPTKSGVIGLIFCALGLEGSQTEALHERFNTSKAVYEIGDNETDTIEDFHIINNGYQFCDFSISSCDTCDSMEVLTNH